MKIELDIDQSLTKEEIMKYQQIFVALIGSGALNLKRGRATLHFDGEGQFQGVELDYWAFKRKDLTSY